MSGLSLRTLGTIPYPELAGQSGCAARRGEAVDLPSCASRRAANRDERMPGAINRRVTDAVGDLLWTPSRDADAALLAARLRGNAPG